jgi:hypothetical protein
MSIHKRLERLETIAGDPAPAQFPDWPLDDQLEDVADQLHLFMRFHSRDPVRYCATDRELHLLGILCAGRDLGPDGGEYTFPSGLTVRLIPEEGTEGERFLIDTPRHIRAEDLPDWTREHFERMDPKDQARRDSWLYENRHYLKKSRELAKEREAWRRENPSGRIPDELIYVGYQRATRGSDDEPA